MSRGSGDRLVYLCRAHENIDYYASSSYGNTIDAVQRRFFGEDGVSLRRYEFELEPGDERCHQNTLWFASGDLITLLTYNIFDEMDVGWRSRPILRQDRQALMHSFLEGRLGIVAEVDGKLYCDVRPEGPKVIIIDESRTKKKRQPTIEQYRKMVRFHGGIARIVEEDTSKAIMFSPEASFWKKGEKPDDEDRYTFA
jgi:hypothetical protein